MDFVYSLSGAPAWAKRYQVDATISNVGVPLLIDTAGQGGLNAGTTTSAADLAGMAVDTVTYTATQGTGSDSAERKVGVIINPDAVWRAKMSGGATENTALTLYDVTTAVSTGLTVTTGDDFTSPEFDEGVIWGYTGANAGQQRKLTSSASTLASAIIPFDQGTAVGDNFMVAPYWYLTTSAVQLTTNLFQANAAIAVATGAAFKVVDMELLDIGGDGRNASAIHMYAVDHILGARPT